MIAMYRCSSVPSSSIGTNPIGYSLSREKCPPNPTFAPSMSTYMSTCGIFGSSHAFGSAGTSNPLPRTPNGSISRP